MPPEVIRTSVSTFEGAAVAAKTIAMVFGRQKGKWKPWKSFVVGAGRLTKKRASSAAVTLAVVLL